MFIPGILASNIFGGSNSGGVQNRFREIQQDFQQLGQDLSSGNLAQAQSDFSALQQILPAQGQSGDSSTQAVAQASNPVQQAISQLAKDLSAGNLTAAQSDFAALRQDLQKASQGSTALHHHHHHGWGVHTAGQTNDMTSLFGELGQELQAGNFTAAQQTYSALQQDFLQFAAAPTALSGASGSTTGNAGLNVSA